MIDIHYLISCSASAIWHQDLPNNYVFQKLPQPKTGYNPYSTTLKKELLKKEGEEREKSRGNSKTFQLPHPISCVITAPKF